MKKAYFQGRTNLNISGSQAYNELCQIHTCRTTAVSKPLVFGWHKKVQDGFKNLKDRSRPGQLKTAVTNDTIVAVLGLIKRDARLTVNKYAQSVGISSGSAHIILTHQF